MQRERKDKHFVKKPIYPGGLKSMREFIRKEMKYPKEALENKIEGHVYLKYEIDYKGTVTSSKVMTSLGYGCDEEAQRIVSLFQFEVPKGPRKMRVKFHKTIRIRFTLPKQKPEKKLPAKQVTTSIQYSIVSKSQSPKTNQKEGYNYTISY